MVFSPGEFPIKALVVIMMITFGICYPAVSQIYFLAFNSEPSFYPNYPAKLPLSPKVKDYSLYTSLFGDKEVRPVRFGIKAGLNISNMNFNKGYSGSSVPLEKTWKTGFNVGIKMEIPLRGKFYLDQEYLFTRYAGEFQPFETTYVLDYLSLPVLLQYRILQRFSIAAGPNFEILLKGIELKDGQSSVVTKLTEERNLGLTIGLYYQVTENIDINLRFMHGLNHVGIYQRSGIREFKYEVLQLNTEFIF